MIKRFFKFATEVMGNSVKHNTFAYSAQSAFFMTISFIPLIILLLSLLKFLPFSSETILSAIVSVFPDAAKEFVESLITESFDKSGAAVISITAVSTLWMASFGVFSVVAGLNNIFSASETRGFIKVRIMSMFYTIIFLVVLVLCLLAFVFGNNIADAIVNYVSAKGGFTSLMLSGRFFVGAFLLTVLFVWMYLVVPNRKSKIRTQLPGALVSTFGWIGFSYLFSLYYTDLSGYSYLYGSLSVIVFFMLWLFICLFIMFLGAEINNCLEIRNEKKFLLEN